ncbi:hypothetical protein CSB45_02200 [candidate division KSB3 bacterium]|uniref:DUF370 domain-containing protein n=1 Tax=candidate division KSB3 bacterium TaxID=2044937 RepID=A0A2G6EAG6_9BACT|nr:MAG: hypothetical protein CSB45_02200 [candidate division KSB3 bacterium]PIE30893.1 MAG: hypothetical protein CSA57_00810 [candidate division KSB3 bacterium]
MYLHIGMNIYLWSERIAAIVDVSLFLTQTSDGASLSVPPNAVLVRNGLSLHEVKSCLLTTDHEIHCSNVHCRTLRARWNKRVPG